MKALPEFGTWYPPDETPGIGEGILIAGFECGDREPVIADGFYDGENFKTRQSTVMDEVLAWMPKPKFPVRFKHVLMTEHRRAMHLDRIAMKYSLEQLEKL